MKTVEWGLREQTIDELLGHLNFTLVLGPGVQYFSLLLRPDIDVTMCARTYLHKG